MGHDVKLATALAGHRSAGRPPRAATLMLALAAACMFAGCSQAKDDQDRYVVEGTPMMMDLVIAGAVSAHLTTATAEYCYVEAGRLDLAFNSSIGRDRFRFRVESQQNDVPGRSILAAVSVTRLSAPQEGWLNLDPTAKDVAISLQSAASEGAQGQLAATLTSFDGRAEPMTISGTFQCSRNE